jgi:hypothetical protein
MTQKGDDMNNTHLIPRFLSQACQPFEGYAMRCVAPALLVGALLAGCETPEAASQAEDPPE